MKVEAEWKTRSTGFSLSWLMAIFCSFAPMALVWESAYTGPLWTPATQWSDQTGPGANTQQCVCITEIRRVMNHLTRHDFVAALRLLARIEGQADDVDRFARAAVVALNGYVASELTTLSVCDLQTSQIQVVGLKHAIAVPLYQDGNTRVSIALNRRRFDFSARDRERLELLQPHLAFLYRHACRATAHAAGGAPAPPLAPPLPDAALSGLTVRERDVMQWLACGKTDADIAALLSISPRTVHKHLEHIYVKLGVETRTAAVMRVLAERAFQAVPAQPDAR